MRKECLVAILSLSLVLVLSSCSSTKYVPEDEFLLNKMKVSIEGEYRDLNTLSLRSYVRQTPNQRWFSLFKLPLATYSLSGRDSSLWINRTLKAMGEPPVIYDKNLARRSQNDLTQQLRNEGFLDARVTIQEKRHGKKLDLTYLLQPGEPYFVHHIDYDIQDSSIARILASQDSTKRLINAGMKFDVSRLDAERKRITTLLSDSGYYRFHKDFITYLADTVPGSRLIDLTLRLARYRQADQTDVPHTRYWMRHINYTSGDVNDPRIHLRQHVLEECTHLQSGSPYSATGLQNTYNHFGRMQAVKYTNITFNQVPQTDSLDCTVQIQTNKASTVSFQPEGTNTAGDLGAAASLTYQNRNLFRGSEVLSIQLRGAYEAIKGLEGYSNQDFVEYSAETRLQFPRFISPFINHRLRQRVDATSEVSLLYDLQNRPEFHRRLVSAAWRYKWSFPHRNDRFQVDLLDLNYVFMPWISDTFRTMYLENDNTSNAFLRYNYEDLFITKIGFGYSWSKNSTAFKTNVETSGNLLSLGAKTFGAEKDGEGHYRLFNIAFAQYAKFDLDFSHSFRIDQNNSWCSTWASALPIPMATPPCCPSRSAISRAVPTACEAGRCARWALANTRRRMVASTSSTRQAT